MSNFPYSFEVHIHGQVQLRQDTTPDLVMATLLPLWQYGNVRDAKKGVKSFFEDESGIEFEDGVGLLSFCWSTQANEDFKGVINEVCSNLNDLALAGAALEVSFSDAEFDESEEADSELEPRDELLLYFVGPNPEAIIHVQRDILIQDVLSIMERHFERSELVPVVECIKKLFEQRVEDVHTMLDAQTLGSETLSKLFAKTGDRNSRRLH